MTTEFGRPLVLASPPEKSQRVKDAHYLLAGHNPFQTDFNAGPPTDVMDGQIQAATKRAFWLLGFPTPIGHAFTQGLYDVLVGKAQLSPAYKARRTKRLSDQANVKQRAVAQALLDAKAGIHESPAGSNMQKYGAWYGFNGVAWCCIFVAYQLVHAGSKDWQPNPGGFASYVGSVIDAARAGERHLSITTEPQRGDLATYRVDEHIEFFVEWVDRAAGTFRAVGGNTSSSDGSPSNGGEVAENVRYMTGSFPVTAFVAVGA